MQRNNEIFMPGYPGARTLDEREIDLRSKGKTFWYGCLPDFVGNRFFANDPENFAQIANDIKDCMQLVWNFNNFPKLYLGAISYFPHMLIPPNSATPQMSYYVNKIAPKIENEQLGIIELLFTDKEFCSSFENYIWESLTHHIPLPTTTFMYWYNAYPADESLPKDTVIQVIKEIDDVIILQTLINLAASAKFAVDQHIKAELRDDLQKKLVQQMDDWMALLNEPEAGKAHVAEIFAKIWPNFTIRPPDTSKGAKLLA